LEVVVTRLFQPARIVGGSVIAEREPFAFEATASYRGVELRDPPPALDDSPYRHLPTPIVRRVVVREPHEFVTGEDHFVDLFQRTVAETAALAGTVAPQLLHVLGRGGRAHALVVEAIDGVALDAVLAALQGRGAHLPVEVALAIAAELVGLWQLPLERGLPVALHLGIGDVLITPDGTVRATPDLENDRARQTVGAMVAIIQGNVAYVSPEQIDGSSTDTSGMFTLGLLVYELLANTHPVASTESTSMLQILSRLRNEDLPPLSRRRRVPPAVEAFVATATERRPSARFGSWAELAGRLATLRAGLPPAGSPEVLAALRGLPPSAQPRPSFEVDPASIAGWRSLPHDGLVPVRAGHAPEARREIRAERVVDRDLHYPAGTDGRPMLAHGSLLVDARPVTAAEYARFVFAAGRTTRLHAHEDGPVTQVSVEEAMAYAAWAGKRLPSEEEWIAAIVALGAARLGAGAVWEWTATPAHGGHVVRGGRWRNAPTLPPAPEHRSYETGPAGDVGFRCVRDR
jgi:hypothetical protein